MANPATHSLAFSLMVVVVLMLQCLHMQGAATTLKHKNYHIVSAESFKWKQLDGIADCSASSLAGEEERKPGVKLRLHHINGACSPLRTADSSSWKDFVFQIFERDQASVNRISSKVRGRGSYVTPSDVALQPGTSLGSGEYIVTAGIGTPPQNQFLIIDTGSDVTWTQAQPCRRCYSQKGPIFDPSKSSSYKRLPCTSSTCTELTRSEGVENPCGNGGCIYKVRYGDNSITEGDFGQETFALGSDSFPGFAIGLGHYNTGLFNGTAGILGLGQTPLAFPYQTRSKYGGQFSYCLPQLLAASSSGSFSVGPSSIPANAAFTPLVPNSDYPNFYFVGFNGISVGSQRLAVSRASLGNAGTLVDSGTVITRLAQDAYDALKTAFVSQAPNLPKADPDQLLDTCFDLSKTGGQVSLPTITFHFANNADLSVSASGILFPINDDGSQTCLAFAPVPADTSGGFNIIGNFQQQERDVSFDLAGRRVGFATGSCSSN